MHHQAGSTSSLTSLLLRDLNWTRIGRTHQPLLLVMAAIAAVLGLVLRDTSTPFVFVCFAVALVTVVLYVAGRRATMVFAAVEGKIAISLHGDAKSWESAGIFANAVEHAALRVSPLS
jgi:hypothetical protein